MIKLYYSEDGNLYYSRDWPEAPRVMASIYADEAAMNTFKRKMDFLMKNPVPVINHDKAVLAIVSQFGQLVKGEFYEIFTDFTIKSVDGKYTCEIL